MSEDAQKKLLDALGNRKWDEAKADEALAAGADVNGDFSFAGGWRAESGAFGHAIKADDDWESRVNWLVSKGADVARDKAGRYKEDTLLHSLIWDASSGEPCPKIMCWLDIVTPDQLTIANAHGMTPFEYAADRDLADDVVKAIDAKQQAVEPAHEGGEYGRAFYLLALNRRGSHKVFTEMTKKELQTVFPELVSRGLVPGLKTSLNNRNLESLNAVLDHIKDQLPPRVFNANFPCLVELCSALAAMDPTGPALEIMDRDALIAMPARPLLDIVSLALAKNTDGGAAELVPALLDIMAAARKRTTGKPVDSSSIVFTILMKLAELVELAPDAVAAHNDVLVDILTCDKTTTYYVATALGKTYNSNPEPINDAIEDIGDIIESNANSESQYADLLTAIAVRDGTVLEPILPMLLEATKSQVGPQLMQKCFPSYLANRKAEGRAIMQPLVERVAAGEFNENPMGQWACCEFLKAWGAPECAAGDDGARQAVDICFKLFDSLAAGHTMKMMLVGAINQILSSPDTSLAVLEHFKERLAPWEASSDQQERGCATALRHRLEGKTLDSVADKADAASEKVEQIEADVGTVLDDVAEAKDKATEALQQAADLKVYVDGQLDDMKEFISEVVKKLPIPVLFGTKSLMLGAVQKMTLHFECSKKGAGCKFAGKAPDNSFTSETKSLGKWLKVALSAVQMGLSVMESDPIGGVLAVKDCFDAAMSKDGTDKSFKSFVSEPFLTSQESDGLIEQLRDNAFFDSFSYNAQDASWQCAVCNHEHQAAMETKKEERVAVQAAQEERAADAQKKAEAAMPEEERAAKQQQQARDEEQRQQHEQAAKQKQETQAQDAKRSLLPREGVLCKRGHLRKNWKERRFVIDEKSLRYYGPSKGKLKGEVPTGNITAVKDVEDKKFNRPHAFSVATKSGKTYFITATNNEDKKLWMDALLFAFCGK